MTSINQTGHTLQKASSFIYRFFGKCCHEDGCIHPMCTASFTQNMYCISLCSLHNHVEDFTLDNKSSFWLCRRFPEVHAFIRTKYLDRCSQETSIFLPLASILFSSKFIHFWSIIAKLLLILTSDSLVPWDLSSHINSVTWLGLFLCYLQHPPLRYTYMYGDHMS